MSGMTERVVHAALGARFRMMLMPTISGLEAAVPRAVTRFLLEPTKTQEEVGAMELAA